MKAAHCAYGALTIASSISMRYPSAPKSWFSGPSSFLPFSTPVKLGPYTVVTSNAVRAFKRESQGNCSTLIGSCGFQTMKSSSVLGCLVWMSRSCNNFSAGQRHVVRMDPSRMPRIMFYGELDEGRRPHGRPKLCYKDQLKCSLKQAGINPQSWEQLANDRAAWREREREREREKERESLLAQI